MKRFLTTVAFLLGAGLLLHGQTIDLQWIDKSPSFNTGQSWGVPFAKGTMNDNGTVKLTGADGSIIPTQAWPLAHYSDGSVKWMGLYATIAPDQAEGLKIIAEKGPKKIKKAKNAIEPSTIVSRDNDEEIIVNNGLYEIVFPKHGSSIISRISMEGRDIVNDGKLICRLEDRSDEKTGTLRYHDYESEITSSEVIRSGEVAAVVKVEGKHKAVDGTREWLPFSVYFYVYNGAAPIKMVHSFVFDGEQSTDFIKGLGVRFGLPFREEVQNRHVAFAGEDDGIWSEAVFPFIQHRRMSVAQSRPANPGEKPGPIQNLHEMQYRGERVPDYSEYSEGSQKLYRDWAKYNDFRLIQQNSDGFTIQKRTGDHSTWFGTAGGHRSRGFILAGDVSGSLGVSLKNFWQSFPAELEASNMLSDNGELTVWMWSPHSEAMDLRHYDIVGHVLDSSYEDYVEGYATPYGIARTSELTLFPYAALPSREELSEAADAGQDIIQVMATPQYLHDAGAFGYWSLPDANGNDTQKFLEKQIDDLIAFYQTNIETQRWYGFWNYGDVMHSYDPNRHCWNYDAGGKAWHNTELETDLWLWYSFIRTGRPDIYRMATAMTRHTSEVDAYHIGRMKGLGSRHNVSHWGCGAKEARVGQAWWKRYCYYLTTDDRLGDLMTESLAANEAMIEFDALVRAQPRSVYPTEKPTRLRWGPDWTSLVGNWFTEWERTGDKKWLDMINAGMNSLADKNNLPNGLFTGKGYAFGYDPATGVITYEGDPEWTVSSNHLANIQGSFETMMEVLDEVDNKAFTELYLDYARWYSVPKNDPIRDLPENAAYKNWWGNWNIERMLALPASRSNDEYRAKIAWSRFLGSIVGPDGSIVERVNSTVLDGPDTLVPTEEDARISSNDVAQWTLEAIILQELIGDYIPDLKDIKPAR